MIATPMCIFKKILPKRLTVSSLRFLGNSIHRIHLILALRINWYIAEVQ